MRLTIQINSLIDRRTEARFKVQKLHTMKDVNRGVVFEFDDKEMGQGGWEETCVRRKNEET